jgi:hypothetical protein
MIHLRLKVAEAEAIATGLSTIQEKETREFFPARVVVAPVFVVGCPRSGTTVLGRCLAAHSELGGGDESTFFIQLSRIHDLWTGHQRFQGTAPLREYIHETDLLKSLKGLADSILLSLLRRLYKRRYVDHTPWYAELLPFLSLLYPDSQFLHVIRDGRDVAESLAACHLRGYRWAGASLPTRAKLWASVVDKSRAFGNQLGSLRYKELHYEALCERPTEVLREALAFLALTPESSVLRPLAEPHATPSRRDCLLAELDPSQNLRVHPRSFRGTWPSAWSNDDILAFMSVAGETLRGTGYLAVSARS